MKSVETRNDIVLIGFAGHGFQVDLRNRNGGVVRNAAGDVMQDVFYAPVDAIKGEYSGMIALSDLLKTLKVQGGVNLVLLDACRDNPNPGRGRNLTGNTLAGGLPAETAVLFGCAADQQALETKAAGGGHGVFFYHVLEALRGKAKDAKGRVTWNRLADFVQENVNAKAKSWFPQRTTDAAAQQSVPADLVLLQSPHELKNLIRVPMLASVDTAQPTSGTLRGQIVVTGTPPAGKSQTYRDSRGTQRIIRSERVVVDAKSKGLKNAVIWLDVRASKRSPALPAGDAASLKKPVTVTISNWRFEPRVAHLRVGQTLQVRNNDGTGHPIKVHGFRNRMSQVFAKPARSVETKFTQPESLPVMVESGSHLLMRGWTVVTDHPFVAVTDSQGRFEMPNLPPGDWTFRIWHEDTGYLPTLRIGEPFTNRGRFSFTIKRGKNDIGQLTVPAKKLMGG